MNQAKTQAKAATTCKNALNRQAKLTKKQKDALKYEEARKKQDEDFKKWKETNKRREEEEEKRAIMHAEWIEQNKEMIKQKKDKERRETWKNNKMLNAFAKKHIILCTATPENDDAKIKIYNELNEAIKHNNIHFRVLDRMHKDDKKYIIAIDNYNILKLKIQHFKTFIDNSFIFNEYYNDFTNWYNKFYKCE